MRDHEILRLDDLDGRNAICLAFALNEPGMCGCFVALGDAREGPETLARALSEWAWLVVVSGRLLVDRLRPALSLTGCAVLSEAETLVMAGLAKGWSAEQIAHETGRSLSTVRNQLRSARDRLDARSTAEAVAIAIRTRQI